VAATAGSGAADGLGGGLTLGTSSGGATGAARVRVTTAGKETPTSSDSPPRQGQTAAERRTFHDHRALEYLHRQLAARRRPLGAKNAFP